MPVQFLCDHCHKLLEVGRKKIGSDVTCPKCGESMVVPDEATAAVGVAMHTASRTAPGEAPVLPEFAVFDDDLPPRAVPPSIAPAAPPGIGSTAVVSGASAASVAPPPVARPDSRFAAPALRTGPPVTGRGPMLLVSRTTLFVQAGLFVVVALAAFGAGYLVGRGSPVPPVEAEGHEPIVVDGTLTYRTATGDIEHDAGAVVIVIPVDKFPDRKWSTKGLSPRDPEPAPGSQLLLEVEEIGARYARTDGEGYFQFTVPAPGGYRFLYVSQNATRPTGKEIEEEDLDELRRYFAPAPDLIGRSKYHWTRVELAAGAIRHHSHDFGVDRQ
jgi:hypothetical protein